MARRQAEAAPGCSELRCQKPKTRTCKVPLTGRRAGELCGRALCDEHGDVCGPHRRRQAA